MAREIVLALPANVELSDKDRIALARSFATRQVREQEQAALADAAALAKARGVLIPMAVVRQVWEEQLTARLDSGREVSWSAGEFEGFRHGYAGTIYKGQGKTLDHTYLYRSHH